MWVEWGFGAHSREATTSNLRKICANKHAVIKLYWEWGALQGWFPHADSVDGPEPESLGLKPYVL